MKKHTSVFGLCARCSFYKILGLLAVTLAVEAGLFILRLKETVSTYHELLSLELISLSDPERVVDQSGIFFCFAVSLVLLTLMLCLPGCAFSSQTGYTLRRLSVSERTVFLHQAIYNVLVYLLFFASHALLLYILGLHYVSVVPEAFVSEQTLFLAFYRNPFLHGLLPLSDWTLWLRNACLVLSLGVCAAEFPYKQRRGKFSLSAAALLVYLLVFFRHEVGDLLHALVTLALSAACAGEALFTVFRREREVSEDE